MTLPSGKEPKSPSVGHAVFALLQVISTVLALYCFADASAADTQKPVVLSFPANTAAVDVDNEFTRANPAYKQRAGSFYEITYLAKSTEGLIALATLTDEQKPSAFEILRAFIYDFLDSFARDSGKITNPHRSEVVAVMDARFKQLLSERQFEAYLHWRDDATGQYNTLGFLVRP